MILDWSLTSVETKGENVLPFGKRVAAKLYYLVALHCDVCCGEATDVKYVEKMGNTTRTFLAAALL